MNIIEIITLNRHGDFQEVIFSSLVSYLLNPSSDHGLKQVLLKKVVGVAYPEMDDSWLEKVKVTSEYTLGREGRVDIYIELVKKVVAIEIKIWDKSAKNVSEGGISQVVRYCDHLSQKYENGDWRFIYLIPTFDSSKCLSEFEKAYSKNYAGNLKLMAWNSASEENPITNKLGNAVVDKSIMNMIVEILENKEVKRVDIPLGTQWLLDSLYDFIPNLMQHVPDAVKFPTKADLEKNPATWKIFEEFFTVARRWPSPILTTVGVPYGYGANKVELHGNSLYRIRTTVDHYTQKDVKEENLPKDKVELELWPDVYEKVEEAVLSWVEKLNRDEHFITIGNSNHIDSKRNVPAIVVSISKGIVLTGDDVSNFNAILRDGFDKLMKAPQK